MRTNKDSCCIVVLESAILMNLILAIRIDIKMSMNECGKDSYKGG